MNRQQRVERSYKLIVATGGFGVAGIVFLVLPGFAFLTILAFVAAAVCGFLLKQTLNP